MILQRWYGLTLCASLSFGTCLGMNSNNDEPKSKKETNHVKFVVMQQDTHSILLGEDLTIGLVPDDKITIEKKIFLNADRTPLSEPDKVEKLAEVVRMYESIDHAIEKTEVPLKKLLNPNPQKLLGGYFCTVFERGNLDNVVQNFPLTPRFFKLEASKYLCIAVPQKFNKEKALRLRDAIKNLLNPATLKDFVFESELGHKSLHYRFSIEALKELVQEAINNELDPSEYEVIQPKYSFTNAFLFFFASIASIVGLNIRDQKTSVVRSVAKSDLSSKLFKWSLPAGLGVMGMYELLGACGMLKK